MHNRESISLDTGQYIPEDDYGPGELEAAHPRDTRGQFDEDRGQPHIQRPKQYPDKRSRIPSYAPRPMDHQPPRKTKKAKRGKPRNATQREAEGIETAIVEFDGETYEIPADTMDWDLPVTEAFESGRVVTAIRGLLGPRQYQVLLGKKYTNRRFAELFQLLAEAGGFDNPGN